jgi:hypothetical protein
MCVRTPDRTPKRQARSGTDLSAELQRRRKYVAERAAEQLAGLEALAATVGNDPTYKKTEATLRRIIDANHTERNFQND